MSLPIVPEELMLAIRSGQLDDHLDSIDRWRRLRIEAKAIERVSTLAIGDKIRISYTVRPQLLAGALCTVSGFEGDKVCVILEHTQSQKWRAGNSITLPRTLVGPDA